MYLKKSKYKNGRTFLSINESYRDPASKTNKNRSVMKIGYLDDLAGKYDDPVSHFKALAAKMTEENESQNIMTLKIDTATHMDKNEDNVKNLGYIILSKIYHELEIDKYLLSRQRSAKFRYNTNSIMQLLVFARIIYPGSKLFAFNCKEAFFERFDFKLEEVYRSLSFFSEHKEALQLWMHERVLKKYSRDTSLVYYDLTNYYFETDQQDGFRMKGVCKEHRPDPIVQMGLFMDRNGIPVSYKLFAGNEADCMTLRPMISETARNYSLGRIIVVADKGVISSDNIWYTLSARNGYVFSYSVRKSDKAFKDYVLDQDGYRWNKDKTFKIKSRLEPRTIKVTSSRGGKICKQVEEKQVIVYSDKYAEKARHDREQAVQKAKDLIKNPSRYDRAASYGAAKYIKNLVFDKDTGEIMEDAKNLLVFDEEKLKDEAVYDGYYAIVTSEIDMGDNEILDIYHGLWEIEETFKITKSTLETRPVYVSLKDHIEAHFLTCFIALVLVRLLEFKLDGKFTTEEIISSLKKYNCSLTEQNLYMFTHYSDVICDIGKMLGMDLGLKYAPLKDIKNKLGKVKK
ncbi:MAG TPA: IS1634 family transposase [Clostridia bacterium]|nr:IS1634 family transposase [Clostridia bacterium]